MNEPDTDHALLALAAGAVGYTLGPEWDCYYPGIWVNGTGHGDGFHWRPLTERGDALGLAIQLGFMVDCSAGHAVVYGDLATCDFVTDADPLRAIVRAAADIGGATNRLGKE